MPEYRVDVTLTLEVEATDPSRIEAAADDLLFGWIPADRLLSREYGDWSEG